MDGCRGSAWGCAGALAGLRTLATLHFPAWGQLCCTTFPKEPYCVKVRSGAVFCMFSCISRFYRVPLLCYSLCSPPKGTVVPLQRPSGFWVSPPVLLRFSSGSPPVPPVLLRFSSGFPPVLLRFLRFSSGSPPAPRLAYVEDLSVTPLGQSESAE